MKRLHFAVLTIVSILLAGGCVEEKQETKAEKTAHYFNSALTVGQEKFQWETDDCISVWDGTEKGQNLSNSSKVASTAARFSGYAYAADVYYAAFSKASDVKWETGDKPVADFTLPELQVVPETGLTYAKEALSAVSVVKKGSSTMNFDPATATLSFSIGKTGPSVASVALKSLSGKILSGDFTSEMSADGTVATSFKTGGNPTATLRSYDGECPLNEGTYYLFFAPGTYAEGDLELSINYNNGKSALDTLSKLTEITEGGIFAYGELPEYVNPADTTKKEEEDPVSPGQIENKYDIYLLIGQSNMAGRGTLTDADKKEVVEGVYLLGSDDTPVAATHPFNQYSTVRKDLSIQQMNPGYGFSKTVYAYEKNRPILIVCNAIGGSSIAQWAKGSASYNYYSEAVRRTKEAMKYGTLKGILWHQGCSDCSRVSTYMGTLNTLVTNLRNDLGAGTVPFVAGELAYWRSSSPGFNEMIRTIANYIPNSDWVSAEDCGALKPESLSTSSPDPHFSRDGQILLGNRYGEKIIEMVYKEKEPSTLKLTSASEIKDIPNSGGTYEATVESNALWTVSVKSGSTAAVTLLSSGGNKNGSFSFKVGTNTDRNVKTATIVVSCEGCSDIEISLTQKAASAFMAVFPEAKMVDASVFSSLPCPSRWFKVVSDKAWTAKVGAETTASGVTLTTTSGSGNLDKFEVKVGGANKDWNNRKKIVIEFTLSDGSVEKVTMYQEKGSILALEFRDQDNKTMNWPFAEDLTTSTATVTGGVKGSLSCEGYVFPYYGLTCVCKEANYGWRIGTGAGSYFESPAIEGKTLKKVAICEKNGNRILKPTDTDGNAVTTVPASPTTSTEALVEFTVSNAPAGKGCRFTIPSSTLRILYLRFEYE